MNEIDSIISCIHEIVSVEMYGGIVPPAGVSMEVVDKFILLAQEYLIALPDIRLFTQFAFEQNHGWGKPIQRKAIPIPYRFE